MENGGWDWPIEKRNYIERSKVVEQVGAYMAKYRHRMYKAHCLLNSQLYLYMYLLYIYINLDGHRNSFLFILSPKFVKRAGNLRKVCIFRAWEAVNTVLISHNDGRTFFLSYLHSLATSCFFVLS